MVRHKMVHGALGLGVSEISAVRMSVERGLQLGAAAEIGPLQCANNVSKAPLPLQNFLRPRWQGRTLTSGQCQASNVGFTSHFCDRTSEHAGVLREKSG